jgi:hypothetical protein
MEGNPVKRVIGMDIHRTFAEVVVWEDGRLRQHGRVDMTRSGLEGFGRGLTKDDEVVVEATGNAMAVVRVLGPPGSRPTRSTPASWPRFGPPTSCPRCGCPTPRPSACAGSSPAATRSCATAPG